jgi:aminoglycoside 2'-N-acetyltransferase I
MALEIRTVSSAKMTEAESQAVAGLCGPIFNCNYRELMDLAPVRTHVLGYDGGTLVAHALWLDRPLRIAWGPWFNSAYVEGVATHPDHRGRGYGAAIMRRLQEEIVSYPLGALSPANDVVDWYLALGWERWQGPLWIEEECSVQPTPEEIALIYRTPKTPPLNLSAALAAPWRPFDLW